MTVYFALGLKTGLIKIGCTKSGVKRRLSELQHKRDERLVLLVCMPGGRRVESYWLRRHAASGQRHFSHSKNLPGAGRLNEWFEPTPLLLADIAELIDIEEGRTPTELQSHRSGYRAHAVRNVGDGARA